ncbi:PotD/PotF family extracellular solute-binding protein [Actibacterium sp. 188UL27-1]|uniref:ABC transporter substrate-binding protein n=1 Tax=Actibacterium sp. 188UL27-1 TaxID=2786961 RepID=UPI00195DC684|nr:extracellular solute-binding protein [Actibacterium sp. 188UL27-1]MBM7067211.1 extracellular solute-binding protein [Actibacterium sp. 188UL27-1]
MPKLITPSTGLIKRRTVLRGLSAGAAALAAPSVIRAQDSDKTLNLLCWPGHNDPAVIGLFEEATGIKVVAKEYVGGDNMVALVNQSPVGTYDVILSDAEFVIQLRDGGFIDPMTAEDYPFEDFFPEFQKFPGHWLEDELYSVIIRYGFLGVSYRTDILTREEVETYQILLDPKVAGKVGYFDWYLPSMGCLSCGAGNDGHPYDIDEDEFAALVAMMDQVKAQTSGFYSMADTFSSLTNGDASIIPGVGDWITQLLAADGVPVDSWVPKEGGVQWTESMSIGKGSAKQDMAKQFIQYMTSPEGQALSAVMPAYNASIPSKAGWEHLNANMPDDAKRLRMTFEDNNVMDDYAEGKINIRKTPIQQEIEDWTDVWADFKA